MYLIFLNFIVSLIYLKDWEPETDVTEHNQSTGCIDYRSCSTEVLDVDKLYGTSSITENTVSY